MALGLKKDKKKFKVFALLGDGELSEGSVWEAAISASKYQLDNLVVIIDRNKLQITGRTEDVNPIEPLKNKFETFGFMVYDTDGNDLESLSSTLAKVPFQTNSPNLIIANTTKGSGISFIEDKVNWHHKVPNEKEFDMAIKELDEKLKYV